MTQYIDKDALVAEIERRIHESLDAGGSTRGVYLSERMKEDSYILSFIDTLEVKEADLEKEYKEFVDEDPVYSKLVNGIVGKSIAKHFFELGLKVNQKGK